MPEIDEGFSPIPAQSEPPDAGQELTLQDALADGPQAPVVLNQPPTPLGRAPAYDFVNRRMLPGGAGGPLMTRGRATLATWVEKCIRTRRGENPAVDPGFGCDLMPEDLLGEGAPFDESAVSEYLAGVRRALLSHPRISGVEDLQMRNDMDDDAVFLRFRVVLDNQDLGDITFDRLPIGP